MTIDGRQSKIEGSESFGFILAPSSTSEGIYVNEYGANDGPIKLLRIEVLGAKPSADFGSIDVAYASSVEIAFSRIYQTEGNSGDCIRVYSDPNPGPTTIDGSIHHNDIECNPCSGYGAITQKRTRRQARVLHINCAQNGV